MASSCICGRCGRQGLPVAAADHSHLRDHGDGSDSRGGLFLGIIGRGK